MAGELGSLENIIETDGDILLAGTKANRENTEPLQHAFRGTSKDEGYNRGVQSAGKYDGRASFHNLELLTLPLSHHPAPRDTGMCMAQMAVHGHMWSI